MVSAFASSVTSLLSKYITSHHGVEVGGSNISGDATNNETIDVANNVECFGIPICRHWKEVIMKWNEGMPEKIDGTTQ